MKEKIERAEYALRNLETLKENIQFYAGYAKELSESIDEGFGLEDVLGQAETGVENLVDYLKEILSIADPPKMSTKL